MRGRCEAAPVLALVAGAARATAFEQGTRGELLVVVRGKYSPIAPVAYGAPAICPNANAGVRVLSAVVGLNADLMAEVARLWITPSDRIIDVTYGRGAFWRKLSHLAVEGSDLLSGTDCRALPHADASIDVAVFDPPYQPMHGQPGRQFGVGDTYASGETSLQTIEQVLGLYEAGLKEIARVLRPGGRVLVKTQDLTYNHRLHLVHLDVLRRMVDAGLDLADMFVLVNQSRMPQPTRRQQRAHRGHSYLLVGVAS